MIRNTISGYAEQLRVLNDSTEQDFLLVGENLADLSARAGSVSEVASSVIGLVASEESGRDMETLRGAFDLLGDHFEKSRRTLSRSSGEFRKMLTSIESTHKPLSVFAGIVKRLHVLGVSTKIESARLVNGDNSFEILAEDVESLARVIATKYEDISKGVVTLERAMEGTLSIIVSFEQSSHEHTRAILSGLTMDLSVLSERRALSRETASRLASEAEDVSKEIGEVVSSLQFHDITRQQIEHVIDVFGQIVSEGSSGTDGTDDDDGIREIIEDIGGVQTDQLDHARKELVSAVGRVMEHLRGIAERASRMATETTGLLSTSHVQGSSFLSDLKDSASGVIASLVRSEEAETRLAGSVGSVLDMIGKLSAFVHSIEEIGLEIELIALNAQIKAARAAGQGGPLGVLAGAIKDLSDSACGQTRIITDTLAAISESARLVEAIEAEGKGGATGSVKVMMTDMEALADSLGRSQAEAAALLHELNGRTLELTGSTERIRDSITAHQRAERVIQEVIGGMRRFGAGSGDATRKGPRRATGRLEGLAHRYTVDRERQIHELHINGKASAVGVGTEGLGGNVELF